MKSLVGRELAIDAYVQDARLRLCGIDPALYAGQVDPSAFTAFAIQEAERSGNRLPTGVHAGQRLTICRFPALGEQLTVTGHVADPVPADRGAIVRFAATLHDGDGQAVVETTEDLLVLDPSARTKKKNSAPVLSGDVCTVERQSVSFTPEAVTEYCGPDVNPIHFDPEAAAKAGFRAPIVGGEQAVRHIMALIWVEQGPVSLDVSLRFARPLFWDDECVLTVEEADGVWKSVSLSKEGKSAVTATIYS